MWLRQVRVWRRRFEYFQQLNDLENDNASEIRSVVDRINRLAGRVQEFNARIRTGSAEDAGVEAGLHTTIDELLADANIEALRQEDGTYTLLIGGEQPLVIGTEVYELSASFDSNTRAHILTSASQDITGSFDESRLASLLNFRHKTLAEIKGDGAQQGDLNRLAQSIRDRVSQTWPPPAASFFVSSAAPGSIAQTIAVNPALTATSSLSAVESGPPVVANGKALQLAALANPTQSTTRSMGLLTWSFMVRSPARSGRS